MALLLDVFGFLSVVLRGLTVTAQSLTIGGIAFLVLLARPLAFELDDAGEVIVRRCLALLRWSAVGFAAVTVVSVVIEALILADSAGLSAAETIGANFVVAGIAIALAALAIAWLGRSRAAVLGDIPLLALAPIV